MTEKTKEVKPGTKPNGDLDTTKAQEVLEKAAQERTQKCEQELAAVLKKHNCVLVPILQMQGDQIRHLVQVMPNR